MLSTSFTKTLRPNLQKFFLSHVRQYNCAKHHIIPGFKAKSITEVAQNLLGLHSARLSSPFVILHTRLSAFNTDDLINELYFARTLIKLRCMRKTIHIVPLDMAPVVHQATMHLRRDDCLRFYRHINVSNLDILKLKEHIIDLVMDKPISSNDILDGINHIPSGLEEIRKNTDLWKKLVRMTIKDLWEEGFLCYINTSSHWGSENRVYGYTQQIYPDLDLHNMETYASQIALVQQYISTYGPVTEEDICWWSGLSKKIIRNCLHELTNMLDIVEISEIHKTFYMMKTRFDEIMAFNQAIEEWITFLAYEDSSLKGYFESRSRYVKPKYYKMLFNQIGEANASIMSNGEVIGIWKWDKKKQKVDWYTFETFDERLAGVVQKSIDRLEDCLRYQCE